MHFNGGDYNRDIGEGTQWGGGGAVITHTQEGNLTGHGKKHRDTKVKQETQGNTSKQDKETDRPQQWS